MKNKWNLHTHSTYCDGKNTLKENIEKAISLNFLDIGFSSHSHTGIDDEDCELSLSQTNSYFSELTKLKKEYKGKINIFSGLEIDYVYPILFKECDYHIGSIHFFKTTEGIFGIDNDKEMLKRGIEILGGWKNFLIQYFSDMIDFATNNKYDITGHFDLYTKFENRGISIDLDKKIYEDLALNTIEEIVKKDKIIEVNTGAISRGYKNTTYPAPFILKRMQELNSKIILSSDAHNCMNLDCNFNETEEYLKQIKFKYTTRLTNDGFVQVKL